MATNLAELIKKGNKSSFLFSLQMMERVRHSSACCEDKKLFFIRPVNPAAQDEI